MLGSQKIWGCK